jgi:hypothetical protein
MALITAQLLFVDRIDDQNVRLDVIVLDRAETRVSPAVGAGLAFDFRLPADGAYRQEVASTIARWADGSMTVGLSLMERRDVTQVVVTSGAESVILRAPEPVA